MKIPYTSLAIQNLKPGALWELRNEDYDTLVWNDKLQTRPTKSEVVAEATRIKAEYDNNEYQRLRAREYPPVADYLDAVVKGDLEQQQAYIDACLAVKAKYPKSEGV
jgi:hypothetical protein